MSISEYFDARGHANVVRKESAGIQLEPRDTSSLPCYVKKEGSPTATENLNVVDFKHESEAFLINKRLLDDSDTTERDLLRFHVQNISLLKPRFSHFMHYTIMGRSHRVRNSDLNCI